MIARPATPAICLSIMLSLLVALSPPANGQEQPLVTLIAPDIPPAIARDYQAAIDATLAFFKQELGADYRTPVRIYVYADATGFARGLVEQMGFSTTRADEIARSYTGWAGKGVMLINLRHGTKLGDRFRLVGHELTHFLQEQLSGSKHSRIMWMMEGTANVVGFMIASERGLEPYEIVLASHSLMKLKGARVPKLEAIMSVDGWNAAIRLYSQPIVYATATLAADYLVRTRLQLITLFFQDLQSLSPLEAFTVRFGPTTLEQIDAYVNSLTR